MIHGVIGTSARRPVRDPEARRSTMLRGNGRLRRRPPASAAETAPSVEARLVRFDGNGRHQIDSRRFEALRGDELTELTLEHSDGILRLLQAGDVVLEAPVSLGNATFGLGFMDGGGEIESASIKAESTLG